MAVGHIFEHPGGLLAVAGKGMLHKPYRVLGGDGFGAIAAQESTTITSSDTRADSIQAAISRSSLWVKIKIENMDATISAVDRNAG